MVIRSSPNIREPFTKNVSFMFVVYWGILVLWQNVSNAELRGTADLFIKIGLLAYFVIFYLVKGKTVNTKALVIVALGVSLMITAGSEGQLPLSSFVAYLYPILILLMVYGVGDKLQINRSQLVAFCNCVIGITMYAAVYALIFCWDQFSGALSVEKSYGNELSSFFVSNHEYGMYLVAAIISCIVCLRLCPNLRRLGRNMYIAAIVVCAINLILTFSRTSLLGMCVFLLVYFGLESRKNRKWLVFLVVLIVALLNVFPALSDFTYKIVLKENQSAGRDELFAYGIQYFENGSVFEKIFGHGVTEIQLHFEKHLSHESVHNAYLQTLLYFGLIGCFAMIFFILSQVVASVRFLKTDRFAGAFSLSLVLSAVAMMFTNTAIIFTSAIDSFFLTAFFILVPKYIRNSVQKESFLKE